MTPTALLAAAAAVAAVAVAASNCGGGGSSNSTVTPTPPVQAAKFEDQFGSSPSGFGATFGQGANTEPRDANPGDIIPVNPTAEPVPLPGT